ncbi:MAG: cation:proton antiporter [Longimicrobiales bacterium]
MNPLLGALLLLLIGLLGARLSFGQRRGPLGPRLIFVTGTHFLFLGFILGAEGLGLITRALIDGLFPFIALGLGWIGLLFGVQLDQAQLRRFPAGFLRFTLLQGALAFIAFAAVGFLLLAALDLDTTPRVLTVLLAAATACVSTPAGIALIRHNYLLAGKTSELLLFIASLDAIVGIVALQLIYAAYHPAGPLLGASAIGGAEWLFMALAIAVALAVMFLWLSRPKPARDDIVLFLLGLVVFGAGAALYLGLSPLFICGLAGALLANLSPLRRRLYTVLEGWEKPIYVVLLILAGALLSFETWLLVPTTALYFLLRTASKLAGGWVASGVVDTGFAVPGSIGLGLVSQGGISVAMVISAALSHGLLRQTRDPTIELLFSTVVLAVVLSELTGPFLSRSLLRRLGEIKPRVEAALAEGREPGAAEAFDRPESQPERGAHADRGRRANEP